MLNALLSRFRLTLSTDREPGRLGLYRTPNPNCWDCDGQRGWYDGNNDTEDGWWEPCPCTLAAPLASIPLPYRRRQPVGNSQEPPW